MQLKETQGTDIMLTDLLLRCVLLIVSDNEELANIAFQSIYSFLIHTELSLPARDKYFFSSSLPQRAPGPRAHRALRQPRLDSLRLHHRRRL